MRHRFIGYCIAAAISAAIPARASMIITALEQDLLVPGFTATTTYTMIVKNGKINPGGSSFTEPERLATTNRITYTDYLSALPSGVTLTGATLNFAGAFLLSDPVVESSGAAPGFSVELEKYYVTISSESGKTVEVHPHGTAAYNLWGQFGADILANKSLYVAWGADTLFSLKDGEFEPGCRNCSREIDIKAMGNFNASKAGNFLTLEYPDPVHTPEPASMLMCGLGLLMVGVTCRKFRPSR